MTRIKVAPSNGIQDESAVEDWVEFAAEFRAGELPFVDNDSALTSSGKMKAFVLDEPMQATSVEPSGDSAHTLSSLNAMNVDLSQDVSDPTASTDAPVQEDAAAAAEDLPAVVPERDKQHALLASAAYASPTIAADGGRRVSGGPPSIYTESLRLPKRSPGLVVPRQLPIAHAQLKYSNLR